MKTFQRLESNVRSYCRSFPNIFNKAYGAVLEDEKGDEYIDFLGGSGTLNYGHNNPHIKEHLLNYLRNDGLVHGLDLATVAKRKFLKTFEDFILKPRDMDYKLQFPGPTGANAVEVAIKIARKFTGRENIISFTNSFHGVTLGALATTSNVHYRNGAGTKITGATFMPYDGYMGPDIDTTEYLDKILSDPSSGVDHPAAVIVEIVQGEGGINVASKNWLRSLEKVCRSHEVLLIVDDIQMGCGRTGSFFSFEEAGISPDIITLSKSLSGFGLPLALVLMKPQLDRWKPGEHNGTFRGHNLAFVTATAALEKYWTNPEFAKKIRSKGELVLASFEHLVTEYDFERRGRAMVHGLDVKNGERASKISNEAFDRGLIIETAGSDWQVLKFLSPLTIEPEQLERGLEILASSVEHVVEEECEKSLIT